MSTLEPSELFDANTPSWRARVRFVRDLAPSGMGVFMAPQRSVALRQSEILYGRTPFVLVAVAISWVVIALALWPEVSPFGMLAWTGLVAAAWVGLTLQWVRANRPMLRPGAAGFWTGLHVANLWLLFLALASAILLIFPGASETHQMALCLTLVATGLISAIFSSATVQALAAVLGPMVGVLAAGLVLRGSMELAASVALAGGLSVALGLGLYHLTADKARRQVEAS